MRTPVKNISFLFNSHFPEHSAATVCTHALYLSGISPWMGLVPVRKRLGSGQATWDTKGGDTRSKRSGRFWRKPKKKKKKKANADRSAPADVTHRRRRTVSALHWRWGEGRKNSERSRVCSHTSHSYSRRGPGTHSHLQRAPQTLVTVGTCGQGQLWLQVVDTIIPLHHNVQHRRQTTGLDFLIVHCKNKSSDFLKISGLICFHTAFALRF